MKRWVLLVILFTALVFGLLVAGAFAENIAAATPSEWDLLLEQSRTLSMEGNLPQAVQAAEKALSLAEQHLDPNDTKIAYILNFLGNDYLQQGRCAEAAPVYSRSLGIMERAFGPDHFNIVDTLNGLAGVYCGLGRLAEAEFLYKRALIILEQNQSEQALLSKAATSGGLAVLLASQGRWAEAEPLLISHLTTYEHVFGKDHPGMCSGLGILASVYLSQGRYDEAEPLFLRALAVRERVLGPDHLDVATSLIQLAGLHSFQGHYAEAEALNKRALAIFEKAMVAEDPLQAMRLLAVFFQSYTQGHYADAEPGVARALVILESSLGQNSPVIVSLQGVLSEIYFHLNDVRALECAQRAFETEAAVRAESFSMQAERQRMNFVQHRGDLPLRIAMSLALQQPDSDSEAARVAWQMVLRSKAAVLDAMLEDRQNLAGNPEAEALFTRLGEVKNRLSALQMRDLTKMDANGLSGYRTQRDALQNDRDDLEQRLARISGRFREGRRSAKATAEEVGKALPENTALIEFLHVTPIVAAGQKSEPGKTSDGPPQYVAFVLTDGSIPPRFIPVGDAGNIDLLIDSCRKKMERGASVANDLRELYRLVWAPLEACVGNKHRILISPDGALNQLPFAALRTPDERYLIERFEIGYLASGRDLIRKVDDIQPTPPALFGDPIFNNRSPVANTSVKSRARLFRSVPSEGDRTMYSHLRLPALPATRDEVEQISKILSERTPSVFLGSDASEGNLKTILRPEMLHLATHGFYFAEPEVPARITPETVEESKSRANPMLRSGLALSGASVSLAGDPPSSGEDGIVTAEEVGSLDLWGTKLVVLSACDTGRGETLSGEGVFGLRRAFVQAGALNLMLTLWRVEDVFTKNLMLEFYRDYVETGDAVGALSRVQRALAKEEPRFWAPFLVSVQGGEQGRGKNR